MSRYNRVGFISTYAFILLSVSACISPKEPNDPLPRVAPVSLNSINPELFDTSAWFVPYYLNHFSTVANSVVDTGRNRGFIDISVWRTPDVNKLYNARIMENILSLSWFYTNPAPWNSYYGSDALRKRIEAALAFWCNIQCEDGRFSEYAPGRWSLAPTAFATKFVGRALYLLEEKPTIDDKVLRRANESLRKALLIGFTDSALWEHGRNFTNQYANLWGGAMLYLQHHPDQTIDQLLTNRLSESMIAFQSPCGYFYEKNGPDWGYNLSTHHSDLQVAWHFAKGTRLEDYFVEKTARWYDWFAYNAVKEPGNSRYYLNKAIETRQHKASVDTDSLEDPRSARWVPQAELVPLARAFVLSQDEYDAAATRHYKRMRDRYPAVDSLKVGEFWAYSPYAFLHDGMNHWLPSRGQKDSAIAELPYLKSNEFVQVRSDKRNQTEHIFVRHPGYYAILNTGKIITSQQRYGLGLLWNPVLGTVLQSQSRSDIAAWGTQLADSAQVFEAADVNATFSVSEQPWTPAPGINDISGRLTVSYGLGLSGRKSLELNEKYIEVQVELSGHFKEIIPLLVDSEAKLEVKRGRIYLQHKAGGMTIQISEGVSVVELDLNTESPQNKSVHVIQLSGNNKLTYRISFND